MTGTVRKHIPTLEALQVLYHRMRFEYEFYNFIRDQFHLTKKKIGLKSVSQPTAHSPAFLRELALRTPEPLEEDEDLDTDLEDANSWLVHPWGPFIVTVDPARKNRLDWHNGKWQEGAWGQSRMTPVVQQKSEVCWMDPQVGMGPAFLPQKHCNLNRLITED